MTSEPATSQSGLNRRTLLRGALAAAALVPLSGTLASCASSGSETAGSGAAATTPASSDPKNPFGVASSSTIDAVIFNGGYGYDYVQFAADVVQKNMSGVTAKVTPSTQIAQQLQPRFVGGNPPDLIDNSGANSIGFNTILDQLATLDDVFEAPNLEGTKISDTLYDGVKAPGTFNGKFVAINYVMTIYAIWYSASLFKENGWSRRRPGTRPRSSAPRPRPRASTCSSGARKPRPTTRRWPWTRPSRRVVTRSASRWRTSTPSAGRCRRCSRCSTRWASASRTATSSPAGQGPSSRQRRPSGATTSRPCSTPRGRGSRTR